MRNHSVRLLLVAALFLVAGCFEVDQEYTLNPDGSGKVVHQVKQPDVMGQGEAGLKNVIESQLAAKGVDAWSDVSALVTDDGSYLFTGTAYFSDLNALKLDNGLEFSWAPAAGGAYRLSLAMPEEGASEPVAEEDVTAKVKEAKAEWNQMKPMMKGIMSSFKWNATFHLPGGVESSASFETSGPQTVEFSMSGDRYFEVIEEMMEDDQFLEAQARRGKLGGMDDDQMPPELMEKLFGEEGVYALTTPGVETQFDYQAAVASAEAGFEAMMGSLPVEAPKKIVPPATGGDFESLRIVSTSYVTDEELSWSQEGATLKIAGTLPGSVVAAEEGELRVAVADDGTDLLPEEEWSRQVSVSLDSNDPTLVTFDVSTVLPPAGAKGFREISGVIWYRTASGPDEKIELFSAIESGAKGTQFDATLGDIGEGYVEGSEQVSLELAVPREEISAVLFFDAAGNELDVSHTSTSWSSDSTSLTYAADEGFPRDGKIVLHVRKGLETYEIPFKVTSIDLLGRPK